MNIIFKPECKTEIIEPTYDLPIIGEPISKTGASANNSNAYGVIVGIIGDGSSRRVRVMTDGYIDYDKVKENYMEYTDEAINALTGITLCSGGKLPTGGSVPKPLTYDYMPEGYPTKTMQTTVLMEEQQLAFALEEGRYVAHLTNALDIVEGQTYTVKWDGTEYKCVCSASNSLLILGNLSITDMGAGTGEPFAYANIPNMGGSFNTLDTSTSHTISVKRTEETVTPMAEEFLPATALITYDVSTDTYSSDFTNGELYARLLDGKHIVLYRTDDNQYIYLTKWTKLSSGRIDLDFVKPDYSVSLKTDGTIGKKPVS